MLHIQKYCANFLHAPPPPNQQLTLMTQMSVFGATNINRLRCGKGTKLNDDISNSRIRFSLAALEFRLFFTRYLAAVSSVLNNK